MGKLTTHILDTSSGRPADDVEIELYCINETRILVGSTRTNDDGRTAAPLLEGDSFKPGTWELIFKVGDYYRRTGSVTIEPAFLEDVVIRFTLTENAHFHVPLLVSPYGYSTYRGS
jgi:5-hydroxyisourate hydrolase